MTDGAVAVDRPQHRRGATERARRSSRLVGLLLAVVCTSACESSTVPGLNVRAAPTTASHVVGRLGDAGAPVVVDCFTRGEAIHGQTMWYRITSPHPGYVTAYYVRRHNAATIRRC